MKRRYKMGRKGVKSLDMELARERRVEKRIHVPSTETKPGLATIHTPSHLHWTSSSYPSSFYWMTGSKQHVSCSETGNDSSWECEDRLRKATKTCSDCGGEAAGGEEQ
jgi:hypothetical protein